MDFLLEDIMFTISFGITLILLGIIAYRKIGGFISERRHNKVVEEHREENSSDTDNRVRLYDLRKFHYTGFEDLENQEYKAFFIDETENEAFGIFLTIGPSIFNTLTKLEKNIIQLDHELNNENLDSRLIHDKLRLVNDSLLTLKHATDQLSDKLFEIYSKSSIETVETEIGKDAIDLYINIVNSMIGFAFDYISAANIIRYKVRNLHPELEHEFTIGTEHFLRIFFVDLMNCINMLDKSIEAYK